MGRPRKTIQAPTVAAGRTVGELVEYLAGTPGPLGVPHETALSVAGAWRRLVRHAHSDDWKAVVLGEFDPNALLEAYARGKSPATLGALRTRLPKGLALYERYLVSPPGRPATDPAQDEAHGAAAEVARIRLRPDWTFVLCLPDDVTAEEIAKVSTLLDMYRPVALPR